MAYDSHQKYLFCSETLDWALNIEVVIFNAQSREETRLAFVNESRFYFFFVRKPKNSTEKKSVCKFREETLWQVFSPAGKIPKLFSDIRQSYLISFYHMHADLSHLSHRMYRISRDRDHAIMQAAPYLGTSSVQTILNDGCSTTFIVVNVAGEAADEAEEEASTVLLRRVVVVDANRPPPPPPWADSAAGSRGGGRGGGGRDAKGTTRGGAHDGAEGGRESEEEGEACCDEEGDGSEEGGARKRERRQTLFCSFWCEGFGFGRNMKPLPPYLQSLHLKKIFKVIEIHLIDAAVSKNYPTASVSSTHFDFGHVLPIYITQQRT